MSETKNENEPVIEEGQEVVEAKPDSESGSELSANAQPDAQSDSAEANLASETADSGASPQGGQPHPKKETSSEKQSDKQADKESQAEEKIERKNERKQIKLNGLYLFKKGMSSVYNEKGEAVVVTVLEYKLSVVSQVLNSSFATMISPMPTKIGPKASKAP